MRKLCAAIKILTEFQSVIILESVVARTHYFNLACYGDSAWYNIQAWNWAGVEKERGSTALLCLLGCSLSGQCEKSQQSCFSFSMDRAKECMKIIQERGKKMEFCSSFRDPGYLPFSSERAQLDWYTIFHQSSQQSQAEHFLWHQCSGDSCRVNAFLLNGIP